MNRNQQIDVPIGLVMRGITLHVRITGLRIWRVRMWLGMQLLQCAARIMGCGIRVEVDS